MYIFTIKEGTEVHEINYKIKTVLIGPIITWQIGLLAPSETQTYNACGLGHIFNLRLLHYVGISLKI